MLLRKRRTLIADYDESHEIDDEDCNCYDTYSSKFSNEKMQDQDQDQDPEQIFKNLIIEKYIKYIYNSFIFCFEYTYKGIKIFIKISGIYIVWIFLHYIASQLYVKICVPNTIIGFLMSPFMTATPHCQGLRWIVYNASNIINNMWLILGSWICSLLMIINRDGITSPSTTPIQSSIP